MNDPTPTGTVNVISASGAGAVHRRSGLSADTSRLVTTACAPMGIMRNGRMLRFVTVNAEITCKRCS